MLYRVIVRLSLNLDEGSKVRNALARKLTKGGYFENTPTGTLTTALKIGPISGSRLTFL
jgi:hypothetical protein